MLGRFLGRGPVVDPDEIGADALQVPDHLDDRRPLVDDCLDEWGVVEVADGGEDDPLDAAVAQGLEVAPVELPRISRPAYEHLEATLVRGAEQRGREVGGEGVRNVLHEHPDAAVRPVRSPRARRLGR